MRPAGECRERTQTRREGIERQAELTERANATSAAKAEGALASSPARALPSAAPASAPSTGKRRERAEQRAAAQPRGGGRSEQRASV